MTKNIIQLSVYQNCDVFIEESSFEIIVIHFIATLLRSRDQVNLYYEAFEA